MVAITTIFTVTIFNSRLPHSVYWYSLNIQFRRYLLNNKESNAADFKNDKAYKPAHFNSNNNVPIEHVDGALQELVHENANANGSGAGGLRRVKHKRRRVSRGLIIALVAMLSIGAIGYAAIALWVHSLDQSISLNEADVEKLKDALVVGDSDESKAFYMLVLGSDARDEGLTSRSDVTMLVRIDPRQYTIDLISIPRDTMVNIDGSTQKINAAYASGGAAGAVRVVSQFAGVDVSHYAEVHFDELKNIVDTLGGIWVNVPESFSAGNGGLDFKAGEQKLNGEQALAFARERYNVQGGDFGRAQAQRLIVEAIIKQVLASSPAEIPGLINQLAAAVTTDFSVSQIAKMALNYIGKDVTIYSAACPSYTLNIDGVSYVGTMFDEWRAMMQRVDAGLDPADETSEIPEKQLNDERLGMATNSAAPRDYKTLAENAMTTDDVAEVAN